MEVCNLWDDSVDFVPSESLCQAQWIENEV